MSHALLVSDKPWGGEVTVVNASSGLSHAWETKLTLSRSTERKHQGFPVFKKKNLSQLIFPDRILLVSYEILQTDYGIL